MLGSFFAQTECSLETQAVNRYPKAVLILRTGISRFPLSLEISYEDKL